MRLTATDRSVRDVLTTYFFHIPRYQRPYSWEADQVDELWEDAVQDARADYFIGSMVLYERGAVQVGVIDGQQRLTTILMLLCGIRDAAIAIGDPALANGTQTFVERRDENDELRYVLSSETSTPFLHDQIMSREAPELEATAGREEEALAAAFARLTAKLDAIAEAVQLDPLIPEERKAAKIGEELRRVRDRILSLRLIFVLVDDADDATTIFVTLNSRGKDLEPADLVKAYLMQHLPRRNQVDAPRAKWERIVDLFDGADPRIEMTEFLLASWRSRHGQTSAKRLHKDVKRTIRPPQAASFLEELLVDARWYLQAADPSTGRWPREAAKAASSLTYFRDFGIRQPMPLLLALVRQYRSSGQAAMSLASFQRLLRAIEDYAFTWTTLANKTSSGGMSSWYARIARELWGASDSNARGVVINAAVGSLRDRRPTGSEVEEALSGLWFTDDRPADKRKVQYALRRSYEAMSPRHGAGIDFGQMTIEHLAPQSAAVPNAGKIGNLIYVSHRLNHELANKPWREKATILRNVRDEWIPPEVAGAEEWDEAAIDARTRSIAEAALTHVWAG